MARLSIVAALLLLSLAHCALCQTSTAEEPPAEVEEDEPVSIRFEPTTTAVPASSSSSRSSRRQTGASYVPVPTEQPAEGEQPPTALTWEEQQELERQQWERQQLKLELQRQERRRRRQQQRLLLRRALEEELPSLPEEDDSDENYSEATSIFSPLASEPAVPPAAAAADVSPALATDAAADAGAPAPTLASAHQRRKFELLPLSLLSSGSEGELDSLDVAEAAVDEALVRRSLRSGCPYGGSSGMMGRGGADWMRAGSSADWEMRSGEGWEALSGDGWERHRVGERPRYAVLV